MVFMSHPIKSKRYNDTQTRHKVNQINVNGDDFRVLAVKPAVFTHQTSKQQDEILPFFKCQLTIKQMKLLLLKTLQLYLINQIFILNYTNSCVINIDTNSFSYITTVNYTREVP